MISGELGYILDFIAGFWIIQSLIFRSKRHIYHETTPLWNGNPLVYESQLLAYTDGWWGVFLLFIGLIFHLFRFEFTIFISVCITITTVLVSLVFHFFARKWVEKEVRKEYSCYDEVKNRIHND